MKLVVGLGNPGPEYVGTRHNAGFMVLDRCAERAGVDMRKARTKFNGLCEDTTLAGVRCLLIKPMTFMNRSGQSVGDAVHFYKLDPAEDLLVIIDDVALPFGTIRVRASGGAGGHNGLRDIERALGSNQYPRLRIGIDPPGRVPQVDYVLGKFKPEQYDELPHVLNEAANVVEVWLREGTREAMNRFNRKVE